MTKPNSRNITNEPGHSRNVPIGTVVAIDAVDWGMTPELTTPDNSNLTIVRGRLFGQVVVCNDEWVTLAQQVFGGGDVRWCISIPWVTVTQVTKLLEAGE
jgi:hypothetical protein